jgi:hypothetical protein
MVPFIELVLSLAGLAGRLDVHECDGDGGADVPAPGQAAHALYRSISEMSKKNIKAYGASIREIGDIYKWYQSVNQCCESVTFWYGSECGSKTYQQPTNQYL